MENKLPTYRIKVNLEDESGVYAVSLVDEPAIEVDWIKLSKEIKQEIDFKLSQDKQYLLGPLLIPGKLIYRRDEKTGQEYNIVFEKETIEIIANKYNKNKLTDVFNINHSGKTVDAYLVENWLVEDPDKSNKYGYNLPEGTWFGKVKVENKEFWMSEVSSENVKGFSVEIRCDVELMELSKESSENEDKYNNKIIEKLMTVKTNEGVELYFDGELAEGTVIFVDEAMSQLAPEGEHTLEDGKVITLDANGAVMAITEAATEDMEEETKTETFALDPNEVLAAIQPALDEFRSILADLATRIDVLEQHEVEMPDNSEFSAQIEELKSQVEKLASQPGAQSITIKNDAKEKTEEKLLSKINFFSKINK